MPSCKISGAPAKSRTRGSPTTSGFSAKRSSTRASLTTSVARSSTACAQNDDSRDVSRMPMPTRDLNHSRSRSRRVRRRRHRAAPERFQRDRKVGRLHLARERLAQRAAEPFGTADVDDERSLGRAYLDARRIPTVPRSGRSGFGDRSARPPETDFQAAVNHSINRVLAGYLLNPAFKLRTEQNRSALRLFQEPADTLRRRVNVRR